MRIAIVHNAYGKPSGEETVVETHAALLAAHGHEVVRFQRSSAELDTMTLGGARAFFTGIYNAAARRAFARFLDRERPDLVHVHNLFPLISPAILAECGRVPTVMTLHNFRLICPNALLLRDGRICHDCLGGREYRCVLHNCEHNFPKSLGYALRTAFVRRGSLLNNVRRFICLTQFQRDLFVREGFPAKKMAVVPNAIPSVWLGAPPHEGGEFVGYVGRVSPEKDVPTLLEAARRLPDIPFKIAGSYWRMPEQIRSTTPNVEFVGHLDLEALRDLYRRMRVLVFATRCYENFPVTLLEAMAQDVPIVCAKIGGLTEIVEGAFYEPGNADDLVARIRESWNHGVSGWAKALRDYHPDVVARQLAAVYDDVR
jgi:glycosyltransferase involved in cell wall biosynthesis